MGIVPKKRKGQSMPINTIIVAAIGLAVLVILFVMFTGKAKIFNKTISQTCQEKGGKCLAAQNAQSCSEIDGYSLQSIEEGCQPRSAQGSGGTSQGNQGPCCLPFGR